MPPNPPLSSDVGDLLPLVLHDIQNHLTSFSGYLQLLQRDEAQLSEKHRRYLNSSTGSSLRVQAAVRNLQTLIHASEGRLAARPTEADLVMLVRSSVAEARASTREAPDVPVEAPLDGISIRCDVPLLTEALRILLTGAITRVTASAPLRVSIRRESGAVEVLVDDPGFNGSPAEIEAALLAFTREQGAAHGWRGEDILALRLASALARTAGASLSCRSRERGGTTWVLRVQCP